MDSDDQDRLREGTFRFLAMLGCDAAEADDLTQEAMLRLLRRPDQGWDARAAQRWLWTVARNALVDLRRRQGRFVSVPWTEKVEQHLAAEVDRYGSDSVWTDAARECVEGLAPKTAVIVLGYYRDGRSRADLAAALGMTEAGVKTALQRARVVLKQCIERKLPWETSKKNACSTLGSVGR